MFFRFVFIGLLILVSAEMSFPKGNFPLQREAVSQEEIANQHFTASCSLLWADHHLNFSFLSSHHLWYICMIMEIGALFKLVILVFPVPRIVGG